MIGEEERGNPRQMTHTEAERNQVSWAIEELGKKEKKTNVKTYRIGSR